MTSPLIELTYPLVARAAAAADVRVVFLKGPFLEQQGLRSATKSVDVDVWVEPAGFDRFLDVVAGLGWLPFHGIPAHAVTLRSASVQHELDVHRDFPGIQLTPEASFDVLWSERTLAPVAGHEVTIPSVRAHTILAALHLMRPSVGPLPADRQQRRVREWREIVGAVPATGLQDVRELAARWQVDELLEPFFAQVRGEEPIGLPSPDRWPSDLRYRTGTDLWVRHLAGASSPRRADVVRAALWPSADAIRQDDVKYRRPIRPLWWARVRRFGRGMIRLPRALTALRSLHSSRRRGE